MVPLTVSRITSTWLDSAVPSSLKDMSQLQEVLAAAQSFCGAMQALGLHNIGDLEVWVKNVHKDWLSKCKAAALDSVRICLSHGKLLVVL